MAWFNRLYPRNHKASPMKGLQLDGHKDMSTQQTAMTLSAQHCDVLILPLQQHKGEPATLQVNGGEQVYKHQCLAIANGPNSAAVHAPTSGVIGAIEQRPVAHPSGLMAPCIILKPDGKDTAKPFMPPLTDYHQQDAEVLLQRLADAGIVGMGGAVFPTAAKLQPYEHIHTFIINGAECEPYISCDDRLMREKSAEIILGIEILLHLLENPQPQLPEGESRKVKALVGIEDNKPQAIAAMNQAAKQQADNRVHIHAIPTIYPGGAERQLIQHLTGKEIPHQQYPTDQGVLCQNVATVYAIYRAVILGEPLISRYVTVTGPAIQKPGNYEAPLGLPIQALIDAAGGYKQKSTQLKMGGSMMGMPLANTQIPVVKATNCILVEETPEPKTVHPCIRCGHCVEVCPVNLLPQQLYWHAKAREFDKAQAYHLSDCIECACCQHVCPSHIPLVDYYRFAKAEIKAQQTAKTKAELARQRYDFRLERLERLKRERAEKLAKHKKAVTEQKAAQKLKSGNSNSASIDKKAAIQAALERAKAKKATRQAQSTPPASES